MTREQVYKARHMFRAYRSAGRYYRDYDEFRAKPDHYYFAATLLPVRDPMLSARKLREDRAARIHSDRAYHASRIYIAHDELVRRLRRTA